MIDRISLFQRTIILAVATMACFIRGEAQATAPPAASDGTAAAQPSPSRSSEPSFEGFTRVDRATLTLSLPQKTGAVKALSLYDFEFEGVPVGTDKLHVKQLSPGVIEITSVAYTSGEWRVRVRDSADYYGLGERFDALNHAHTLISNIAQQTSGAKGSSSSMPVPFFMSTTGYGLWLDMAGETTFDLNGSNESDIILDGDTERLRIVLFTGPDFPKILSAFTGLAGRAVLPPYWAFAPWLSRGHGQTEAQAKEDFEKARSLNLPAGVMRDGQSNGTVLIHGASTSTETSGSGISGGSGFAGSSNNQASFSAENGLPGVVTAGLNAGLSGIPLWTASLGGDGLTSDAQAAPVDANLFMRWTEYAAFSPWMAMFSDSSRMPWEYGEQALAVYRKFATLHMSLFPYRYAAALEAAKTGLPLMRALVLEHQDDAKARAAQQEYLFGPDLLVAPIVEEGTQRSVYLPPGEWIDYWTGTAVSGERAIVVDAALDSIPLYIKRGAILPKFPEDIATLIPPAESGSKGLEDTRRVYELTGDGAAEPVTITDFEGRTVVRRGNTLSITGDASAHVFVRWRFQHPRMATVNGAPLKLQAGANSSYIEFDFMNSSTVAWE